MINDVKEANSRKPIDISSFTNDQKNAYDKLISFINSSYNEHDYKRALIGPAGTGKTYLVKALIQNSNTSYSLIGLSAPTHKACRVLSESIGIANIKCNTLQSDLGLRVNFNIDDFDIRHPPFDPHGKIKIKDYSIYIVDEASMINKGLLSFLEKICQENKCKLIYIGDASQLSPVKERFSPAFKNVVSYELNQIVRQGDDNPISYLLYLLRCDIKYKTFKFLEYIKYNKSKFNEDNTKGYQLCSTNEFQNLININFSDEELTRNVDFAKVIAYTNNAVSSWNKYIRNIIIKDADKSVINKNDLILSYTNIVNVFNESVIKNSEEYILKDVVNYTHPDYCIKGFMVKFIAIHGGKITQPLFIVDHKDKTSINVYIKTAKELINSAQTASARNRSKCWKEFYKFKDSCLLLTNIVNPYTNNIEFNRDLDYGFAITSHKSQGSTVDTAFVDINDIVFDKWGNPYSDIEAINRRLYVACSRCKNKLYLRYD